MALCIALVAVWVIPAAAQEDQPAEAEVIELNDPPQEGEEAPAPEEAPVAEQAGEDAEMDDEEEDEDAAADEPVDERVRFDGLFSAEFDGRWSDDDSDLNLEQYLRLNVEFPEFPDFSVNGALWLHEDLDGDEDDNSAIRDINDAYDSNFRARLLYLYAEFEDLLGGDSTLRVGRQRIVEGIAYNRIDGIYYQKRYDVWDWYAFAGVRASIYESASDEWVLGGGASFRPLPTTRIALDFYYGENDRSSGDRVRRGPLARLFDLDFPREVEEDIEDNVWALSLWQEITPNIRLFGRYSIENGDAHEFILDLTGYSPTWDFTWQVAYRQLLSEVGDRVDDLTGFYRILGPYEEYQNLLLSVHKPINERLGLSLEAEFHNSDEDELYGGNRDYQRYAAILDAVLYDNEEADQHVSGMLALERWDVSEGEGLWAVTGEVTWTHGAWEATLGADYERYEDVLVEYSPYPYWINQLLVYTLPNFGQGYRPGVWLTDTYRVEMREDIHSLYGKLRYALDENQDITARITFEEDDGPDSPYWRLKFGYELRF